MPRVQRHVLGLGVREEAGLDLSSASSSIGRANCVATGDTIAVRAHSKGSNEIVSALLRQLAAG